MRNLSREQHLAGQIVTFLVTGPDLWPLKYGPLILPKIMSYTNILVIIMDFFSMKIKDLNFVDLEKVKVAEDEDNKKKNSMFR